MANVLVRMALATACCCLAAPVLAQDYQGAPAALKAMAERPQPGGESDSLLTALHADLKAFLDDIENAN